MKEIRIYNYRENKQELSKEEIKEIVRNNLMFDARITNEDVKVEIYYTHQNRSNNIRSLNVYKKGSTSLLAEIDLIDKKVRKYVRKKLHCEHELNPDWFNLG